MKKKIFMFIFILLAGILLLIPFISADQTVKTIEVPFDFISQTVANNPYSQTININPPDRIAEVYSIEFIAKGDFQTSTSVIGRVRLVGGNWQDCSPNTWTTPNVDVPSYEVSFDCSGLVSNFIGGNIEFGIQTSKIAQNIKGMVKMTYYNNPLGNLKVFGTEYTIGDNGKVFLQLLDNQKRIVNDGNCSLTSWYPNSSIFLSSVNMTLASQGMYYYDLTIPSTLGVYMMSAWCSYPSPTTNESVQLRGSSELHVNNIPSDVWNYNNRILTGFSFDTINETAIAQEVWNYSNRNLTFFPIQTDLTNYTKINVEVWNYTDRNLTFFQAPSSLTAFDIWSYINRNLTFYPTYPTPNNLTAKDVWAYGNKNLTYYEVNNISSEDIWTYINRTLTDYNQTSQTDLTNYSLINYGVWTYTDRNLTFFPTHPTPNNLTAGDVWNYNNRNLTYYEDVTNYSQINKGVWGYANRNLTYYPPANNLTASDIWNYNGTISDNIIFQFVNKVWNFTGTIVSDIGDFFSEKIWTRTDRNLTYYETTNVTINNSAIAESVWNYINRTLTDSSAGLTEEQNQTLYNIFTLLGEVNETVIGVQVTQDAIAGALQVIHSTVSQYNKEENGSSVVLVMLNNIPVSGADVTGDYYYPNQTLWIDDASFTEIGSIGVYYYNFEIIEGNPSGVYKVKVTAEQSTGGSNFEDNFTDGDTDGWTFSDACFSVIDSGNVTYGNVLYHDIPCSGWVYATAGEFTWEDYTIIADVRLNSSLSSYQNIGILGRYLSTSSTYRANYNMNGGNPRIELRRGSTTIASNDTSIPDMREKWMTFKMVLTGNNIQVYIDYQDGNGFIKVIDFDDGTPLTSGKAGYTMYLSSSWQELDMYFDNMDVTISGTSDYAYSIIDFKISEPISAEVNTTAISEDVWNYTGGRYTHGVEA